MDARKNELEAVMVRFEKFEPYAVLRPELEKSLGTVQQSVLRLAEENLSQQF